MLISTVSPGGSPPIYNSRWRLPHFLQIQVEYACATTRLLHFAREKASKSRQRYLLMNWMFL